LISSIDPGHYLLNYIFFLDKKKRILFGNDVFVIFSKEFWSDTED